MKSITTKLLSMCVATVTFGAGLLFPGAFTAKDGVVNAAGSTYTASDTYYFADWNCGYYTEPTAPGTYQTVILIHGSGSECASWLAQQMPGAMAYWTEQGLLEPMNVIMPWVAHQATNDGWGVLGHQDFSFNYTEALGLNIENITGKADTSKYKTAIAGYSMGGCDALTAAALHPDLYKEIGSISSSFTFYKYDDPKNDWSNFHSTSEMGFTSDQRCYITYGAEEARQDKEHIFEPSANCYAGMLRNTFGATVEGPYVCQDTSWGKHGNRLFLREIYMYLYYLQHGVVPTEAETEKACKNVYKDYGSWSVLSRPTKNDHHPSAKTQLTVSDAATTKTNVTFGESYTVSVKAQGGSGNYTYDWQYCTTVDGTYYSTTRTDSNGNSLNGKSSLTIADATRDIFYRCVVSDGTSKVTSKPVQIHVAPKINSITSTGYGKTLVPNETYTITVNAEGQNLEYMWEYSYDGGKTWYKSTNTGYNTATATYVNREENHLQSIIYRCTVTSAGSSSTAMIKLGK